MDNTYTYSSVVRQSAVDEYLTPPRLATAMAALIPPYTRPAILDAGANVGRLGEAVRHAHPTANLVGVELMEQVPVNACYTTFVGGQDFQQWDYPIPFDAIISNPPYSRPARKAAEQFIRKGLSLLKVGGHYIVLVRAAFLNAKLRSRSDLFENLFCIFYTDRPSFYKHDSRTEQHGTSKTNTHDYNVLVFKRGYTGPITTGWIHWYYEHEPIKFVISTESGLITRELAI